VSALLSIRGLTVRFPVRGRREQVQALSDVGLEIARGEALGLVGESGSGKSTVARALLGLVRPSAGTLQLEGQELAGLRGRARRAALRRIGAVFQDPFASLDPRLRVEAIVGEPLAVHALGTRRERAARVAELLEQVGLSAADAARFPHEFSGGQRQRIAIARALAARPELLVCDEPTSALDVSVQAQIVELFAELQRRHGLAFLFISHDLAVVRRLCARVAVLYLGRVVECAPRAELFERPRHPYTRALLDAVPSPVPEAARRVRVLGGEVPSPLSPPSGCAFHPRCPEVARVGQERCRHERPGLEEMAGGTGFFVACHLHGSRARQVGDGH